MKKKKKIIILIIAIILLLSLIFSIRTVIINNDKEIKPEELTNFSWEVKMFTVNDKYEYNFLVLVTVQEIEGIDKIKYISNGEEIELICNGNTKVAFDFEALENVDYEIKITPVGESEKTEILNVKRKVSGKDTYKLVKGVYMNTPFLENFNEKYTRYLSVKDENTLTPANWIFDEEPADWYDYNNQKWANIYVEAEGVEAYYVWIPRYVYKLDQTTQRSDVKFVDVYNNYINAETGETITYNQLLEQGYKLPEAFEFGDGNDDKGLLRTSISGYWVSKYQLSELGQFNINYNMTASSKNIVLKDFTNNVSDKAVKYTYAINGKIVNTSETLDDYTFENLTENESYIINVTALDENDFIVGSMTKIVEPTEVNPPKLEGFDQDTTFYVYWDENGIEHNEVPINREPPQGWYNYTYSNWANIVTRNEGLETYYVWVPRYQYKLNQTSQRSDVKFILGIGSDTEIGYEIPEAFWWDKDNNGAQDEGEQLTGYWISKYQLSIEEANARITAEISPGATNINVKEITGTLLKTTDSDGNQVDVPLKYEYYLNGELKHEGTLSTEFYSYTGLNLNTTYTVNIIARNAETNAYVGAITKKVTTQAANQPDISTFKNDSSLQTRTYYVMYEGEEVKEYVPITENMPENWYDYSESRWANIVVTDGTINENTITGATVTSYFVWVPRYQYKILKSVNDWSNLSTANARTDVKFLSGVSTQVDAGYKIPEAFWWDKNNNRIEDEGEQLTGYWMSKYQLSN